MSRIGEGAENIEHCSEAQFLSDRAHILHRGVVNLSVQEADPGFLKHLLHLGGLQLDVDAQRLQHIGCAALGGGGHIAVLGDRHSGGGDHNGGGGGDVDAVGAVSAGAHDLQRLKTGCIELDGVIPHGGGTAGYFVNRLRPGALGGQRRQKCGVLGGGGLAAHDLIHHGIGLFIAQIFLLNDLNNCILDHIDSS